MSETPLKIIRDKRKMILRDLFFKINKEISLVRLSDINIGRVVPTTMEINILDKYLNLTEEEKKLLQNMELNEKTIEFDKKFKKLMELVPDDLEKGQEILKICPFCGFGLHISRKSNNGHLWIRCEKEGILLCQ